MDEERPNPDDDSGWGSIFGLPIPVRRLRWHFWIFGTAVTVMTGINIAARLVAAPALRWHQIPPAITADIIPTVIFCGVFSPIGVEVIAMVIAAYYTREQRRKAREENRKASEKARSEGLEQGLEQGREESNAAWREWVARMQAAQTSGEPFDEPAPDANGA